jgi:hypothetical protein
VVRQVGRYQALSWTDGRAEKMLGGKSIVKIAGENNVAINETNEQVRILMEKFDRTAAKKRSFSGGFGDPQ